MIEIKGATIGRLTTTKDGGWRMYLDFPGDATGALNVVALNTMRGEGVNVSVSELNEVPTNKIPL